MDQPLAPAQRACFAKELWSGMIIANIEDYRKQCEARGCLPEALAG